MAWAMQPAKAQPAQWANRLAMVRRFARYCSAIDPRTVVPPTDLLPHRYRRPSSPYIYRDDEITRLINSAKRLPSTIGLRPQTYAALFDVGTRISHRRVEACVTEPLADGGEVDACLEQMDRCGVAQRMRMDPFACQCRSRAGAGCNVLLQEISNAKSCHCGTALVEEDGLIGRTFHAGMLLLDQVLQQLRRPRPDGTNAHLVAFAGKADLEG